MKLMIDIPDYKLDEVQNGSIASNEILKAVRKGTPISNEGDLISRSELKKAIKEFEADLLERLAKVMPDNNTTIADVQAYQAAVLSDISKSMAQIADALTDKAEPSNGTTAQWVHSDPHKVKCSKCGCQVSMKAAYNMNYCFECGAKMQEVKKNDK